MGPYHAGEELSLLLLQMSRDVNLCLDLDSSTGGRRSSLQQRPTNRYPFGISDGAIGEERLGSSDTAAATAAAAVVNNNTATMPGAYTSGQSTPFSYPSSPLAGYQLRNETSHADIEASQCDTGVVGVGDGQRSRGYGATFFTATDDTITKAQGGKFEYDGFAMDTKGGQGHGDGKNGTRHGGGGRQSRINSTDSNLSVSSVYSRTSPEGRRASVARRNSAGGTKKDDRKSSTFLTKLYQ
jgi:hypothetical protein